MRAWRCFAAHLNDGDVITTDRGPGGHCPRCGMFVLVSEQYTLQPL